MYKHRRITQKLNKAKPRGYKTFFMLEFQMLIGIKISRNSAFLISDKPRMLFFPSHKCENANNCWHFHIYEQENFVLS